MARLFNAKIDNVPPLDPPAPSGAGLGEKIETTFTRFIQRVFRWGYDVTGELFVNIFDASMKILKPGTMRVFMPIIDEAMKTPGMPDYLKKVMQNAKDEQGEAGAVSLGAIAVALLFAIIGSAVKPVGNLVQQQVNKLLPNELLDNQTVAAANIRGIINDAQYDEIMALKGFNVRDRAINRAMTESNATVGELLEFLRRGLINEAEFELGLKRLGFDSFYYRLYGNLKTSVPPIGDLIRFMVREAFNDPVSQKFGYDEDYPQEIDKYLPVVGLDADWGKRHWRAHWTLPSPTMAYEMLHRGEIDRETMVELLKTADYPKFWRDKLVNISYNLLTRVDIRRLLQAGTISYDDALAEYKRIGYDEQKAQWLTDFAARGVSEKEKDLTRADVVNMYEDGITDRGATAQALVKLGYDSQEAEDILKISDVAIAKAQRTDAINYVKERYAAKQIERAQASNELAQIGLKTNSVERYLLAWDRAATTSDKVPSMADAKRWYLKDYIDEAKYREFVKLNGYSQANIELYVREANDLKANPQG